MRLLHLILIYVGTWSVLTAGILAAVGIPHATSLVLVSLALVWTGAMLTPMREETA